MFFSTKYYHLYFPPCTISLCHTHAHIHANSHTHTHGETEKEQRGRRQMNDKRCYAREDSLCLSSKNAELIQKHEKELVPGALPSAPILPRLNCLCVGAESTAISILYHST
uniref:Secreted protein n=1 Tax=Electrophorus electricus TaxID=8005 RepID=A0AAY5EVE8_ELEEL